MRPNLVLALRDHAENKQIETRSSSGFIQNL